MDCIRVAACLVLCVFAIGIAGCGSDETQFQELTPAQIQQQRAEDKVDLDAEDKAESEFQKKNRQR